MKMIPKRKGYSKPQRNWSTKEQEYVIENFQTMRMRDIAKQLNRTRTGVEIYARRVLGLRRVPNECYKPFDI